MTNWVDVFFCWVAMVVYSLKKNLPFFIVEWANEQLSECAWREGYLTACYELRQDATTHLFCQLRKYVKDISPISDIVVSQDIEDEWQAGYNRAILLWRLNIQPDQAFGYDNPFSKRSMPDVFDGSVLMALDGEVKKDPREWKTVDGGLMPLESLRDADIERAYRTYCEAVQQIKGNYEYQTRDKQ